MLFQVDSLQGLLDRAYYQERIAEMDRGLLQELRAKAEVLAQKEKPAWRTAEPDWRHGFGVSRERL